MNVSNLDQRTQCKFAKISGILYFLMIPLGVFGILYIPNSLVVVDNAALSVSNISENIELFRLSIVSAVAVQIINIFVVVYLYRLLKHININMAKLMVIFIIAAVPIAMLNELTNIGVLALLGEAQYLKVFSQDEIGAMVMMLLSIHEFGIHLAGIFWGLWLFPMGYLVYKSNFIPKFIGVLLVIGCIGYLVDFITYFLFPNFGIVFSEYTFFGEIAIVVWLLISKEKSFKSSAINEN